MFQVSPGSVPAVQAPSIQYLVPMWHSPNSLLLEIGKGYVDAGLPPGDAHSLSKCPHCLGSVLQVNLKKYKFHLELCCPVQALFQCRLPFLVISSDDRAFANKSKRIFLIISESKQGKMNALCGCLSKLYHVLLSALVFSVVKWNQKIVKVGKDH